MNTSVIENNNSLTAEEQVFPPVLLEQTGKSVIQAMEKICGNAETLEQSDFDCRQYSKIAGLISFVGDINWSFVLALPKDSAEELAEKFAGFRIEFESEDISDVVGELTNVIAGVISGNMEREGFDVQLSLPTVLRGDDYEQILPAHFQSERIHFKANDNHFWVKITIVSD